MLSIFLHGMIDTVFEFVRLLIVMVRRTAIATTMKMTTTLLLATAVNMRNTRDTDNEHAM